MTGLVGFPCALSNQGNLLAFVQSSRLVFLASRRPLYIAADRGPLNSNSECLAENYPRYRKIQISLGCQQMFNMQ